LDQIAHLEELEHIGGNILTDETGFTIANARLAVNRLEDIFQDPVCGHDDAFELAARDLDRGDLVNFLRLGKSSIVLDLFQALSIAEVSRDIDKPQEMLVS
jgi:hypothetical protein